MTKFNTKEFFTENIFNHWIWIWFESPPLNIKWNLPAFKSNHRRCSVKNGALRNFAKFTGKPLCPSLFFNKVAGTATLLKKRLWRRCFPVDFVKFLRTPFLQNTSGGCSWSLKIAILIVVVSFLHILYEFYEIKLNVMKSTLNCVSWNSLKKIFHSVSSPSCFTELFR